MKKEEFCGRQYEPVATDTFCFDDIVSINGVKGWVDFIGYDIIALVDEKEKLIKIPIRDIKNVLMLSTFNIRSLGYDIPLIDKYNWMDAQKELGSI